MKFRKYPVFLILEILLISFVFAQENQKNKGEYILNWNEEAPGIWKTVVNEKEEVDLLNTAGIKPKFDAISRLPDVEFPLSEDQIKAVNTDGKIFLRFPLEKDEQIYGLGLNFKTVNQRGRIMRLHVDHYGGRDNGRTHAPVPFYVSSKGYGVLINSARYIDIWVGTALRKDSPNHPAPRDRNTDRKWSAQPESDGIEILIPADGAEIFVFGGPSTLNAVQRYNLYSGGGSIPPKWGLGFWQRVPTLFTDNDVKKEVSEFEKYDFPLDVIGLEPGWQSKSYPCTYIWDEKRYPEPEKFLNQMKKQGIHINLWINPYISPELPVYDELMPYTGSHTVWCGPVPDYTIRKAREIILDHFEKEHLNVGVSGYKVDECDGYDNWLWPDAAMFPSGLNGEQMRQVYALVLQRMTSEMFREHNIRTYGLVRASNAGATSFPYVIYNDYYSHRDFITALINSSFCGVLWTPEVRQSETGEECLRRMQSVCFSPMAMINAWAHGTKPWSFPEVFDYVREIAYLRIRLLPYIYTAFAKYHFEGIPPFRAMELETSITMKKDLNEEDRKIFNNALRRGIKDQFMVGEFLLAAPMFEGDKERKVILPEGRWYDFYTGEYAGESEIIIVTPGIEKIPLFVKDGGLIPMIQPVRNLSGLEKDIPLEIRHYGENESRSKIYDDDGKTFNFEKGEFTWADVTVKRNSDGKLLGEKVVPGKTEFWSYGKVKWVLMTK
ncbi:TIM-barrel domain-containing protein [candidate division KSB1 bacterium]